jgi:tetratricopeptide (TPR) repeat protein
MSSRPGSDAKLGSVLMARRLDRQELQRQLLLDPSRPELWSQLDTPAGDVPAPPPASPPERAAPVPARSGPQPSDRRVTPTAYEASGHGAPSVRGWKPCFHRQGSAEAEAVLEAQLAEFQALVEAEDYGRLLRRLDDSTAALLATRLPPEQAYALGHAAHEQERFSIAACLLARAVDAGDDIGELLSWALLFHGFSLRALGRLTDAYGCFSRLVELGSRAGAAEAWLQAGVHARVALAWIALNRGESAEVAALVRQLHEDPRVAAVTADLDLLGRVCSTLGWLERNDRAQLSHAEERATCGLAIALDDAQLSPCSALLRIRGWLVDTGAQVRDLCVVRGRRVWRLDLGQARYSQRSDLADVISRCGGSPDLHVGLELVLTSMGEERSHYQPGEALELFVVLANGDQFCLRQTLKASPLSADQFKGLLEVCIQEPCRLVSAGLLQRIRELWSGALLLKLQQPAEHHRFGQLGRQPELSVVVPLYGRVDFMEFQLNWFNAWQRRRGTAVPPVQLIYVLDDPRLKGECMALAKRCATLYAMPFELVLNPDNLGFAGANNRGASYAQAPLLLLMNSDVLPAGDASLERLLRTMQNPPSPIGALGARLLFDNGAIQHQGMEFCREPDLDGELAQVWLNDHPLKGVKLPAFDGSDNSLREVQAVTAACLMVERERFEALGGLSTHYIVGDFEDSDFCLQLRRQGLPILVDLAAPFHHLERQSVDLASGSNAARMKLVAANAITHHQRWCSAIERLQASEIG